MTDYKHTQDYQNKINAEREIKQRQEVTNSWNKYTNEIKRTNEKKPSWGTGNSGSSTKLICNQLLHDGHIDEAQFLISMRDFRYRLTPVHLRGYHVWAVPVVRIMRRYPSFSKFIARLFEHRMMYIKSLKIESEKSSLLGHVLCLVGEKCSFAIGSFVQPNLRWKRIYNKKHTPANIAQDI